MFFILWQLSLLLHFTSYFYLTVPYLPIENISLTVNNFVHRIFKCFRYPGCQVICISLFTSSLEGWGGVEFKTKTFNMMDHFNRKPKSLPFRWTSWWPCFRRLCIVVNGGETNKFFDPVWIVTWITHIKIWLFSNQHHTIFSQNKFPWGKAEHAWLQLPICFLWVCFIVFTNLRVVFLWREK